MNSTAHVKSVRHSAVLIKCVDYDCLICMKCERKRMPVEKFDPNGGLMVINLGDCNWLSHAGVTRAILIVIRADPDEDR